MTPSPHLLGQVRHPWFHSLKNGAKCAFIVSFINPVEWLRKQFWSSVDVHSNKSVWTAEKNPSPVDPGGVEPITAVIFLNCDPFPLSEVQLPPQRGGVSGQPVSKRAGDSLEDGHHLGRGQPVDHVPTQHGGHPQHGRLVLGLLHQSQRCRLPHQVRAWAEVYTWY